MNVSSFSDADEIATNNKAERQFHLQNWKIEAHFNPFYGNNM